MTTLRTAAQQALEALDAIREADMAGATPKMVMKARSMYEPAITALRAALAQEQAEPVQEHEDWCASVTQLLLSYPPQKAPCNCKPRRVEPAQQPVAWLQPKTVDGYSRPDLGYETCSSVNYGAFPVYCVPPKAEPVQEPQTLDDAMQQPRAMAQAYESGYKAGQTHERERIIQFLTEMQRQVGDGHNHYGVAAMRIRERV